MGPRRRYGPAQFREPAGGAVPVRLAQGLLGGLPQEDDGVREGGILCGVPRPAADGGGGVPYVFRDGGQAAGQGAQCVGGDTAEPLQHLQHVLVVGMDLLQDAQVMALEGLKGGF